MSALDLDVVVAVPGGGECFAPGGAMAGPCGGAVAVRRAAERDRAALAQMLARCSSRPGTAGSTDTSKPSLTAS